MEAIKFSTTVSGNKLNVTALTDLEVEGLNAGVAKKIDKVLPSFHHIFAFDRSWSMASSLDQMADTAIKCVNSLGEGDKVSVVWYSGQGQHGTIVDAMDATDPEVPAMINVLRSPVGLTCFNEVSKTISQQAEASDLPVIVNFMTDGSPVGMNPETDSRMSNAALKGITDLVRLNVIGFGRYYSRQYLDIMAEDIDMGRFTHVSDFNGYSDLIDNTYAEVKTGTPYGATIFSEGDGLLLSTPSMNKIYYESLTMRVIPSNSVVYIVSRSGFPKTIGINGVETDLTGIKAQAQSDNPELVADFFYSEAAAAYYEGRRDIARDILAKNVKDLHLIELVMNGFTREEVATTQKALDHAASTPDGRYIDGKCSANFVPSEKTFCVMDAIYELASDSNNLYLPFHEMAEKYERTSRKSEDQENRFIMPDLTSLASPVDVVMNRETLNVSIRFAIEGTVKLNKKAAQSVNLDVEQPCTTFRTHTIILDGGLNMDTGIFKVTDETLNELDIRKAKFKIIDKDENIIQVFFNNMPTINPTYSSGTTAEDVALMTYRLLEVDAQKKVIKQLISEAIEKRPSLKKEGTFTKRTVKQIEVLEQHGINRSGNYIGVDVQRAKAGECDSYDARSLNFQVKGASAIPKVDDVRKKVIDIANNKPRAKHNTASRIMADCIQEHTPSSFEELKDTLRLLDSEARKLSLTLQSARIGKVLTGEWWTGLDSDDKGNEFVELVLNNDPVVVNFKTTYKTQYINS